MIVGSDNYLIKTIILLLFVFLLFCFHSFRVFAEDQAQYPEEVTKLIRRAERSVICEKQRGVEGYLNDKESWVVRIFTREKIPLEIWVNYSRGLFWEFYPDKIYYFTEENGWMDADNISRSVSRKLDRRIKFTSEEIDYLKNCFKEKK